LARLARLDEGDRAWLLGELPPALRRELAGLLTEDEEPAPSAPPPARPEGWESLDPGLTAQLLEAEPAWLVSAATCNAEAQWRQQLLQALSARRRHQVEIEDRAARTLGARAARFVLDGCRARLANGSLPAQPFAARSRFAKLVDQMRERFA
jgi:hypothetical protein